MRALGSPQRRFAARLVVALLLGSASVAAVSWAAAGDLVRPERAPPCRDPAAVGLGFSDLRLLTEDGLALAAWWIPAPVAANGTVIFLHGYGANREQSLAVAPFLHRAGYHVLAFDFRAHGESEGTHTTVGLAEVADVRAAWDYVESRGEDMTRVALFGWSMGGAAALNAAKHLPGARAIVVDSAFASLENVAGGAIERFTGLPRYPFGPLSVRFAAWRLALDVSENAPAEAARGIPQPVLIVAGDRDEVARAHVDGEAIRASVGRAAELWVLAGVDHVGARAAAPEAYEARVLAFLSAHLAPAAGA